MYARHRKGLNRCSEWKFQILDPHPTRPARAEVVAVPCLGKGRHRNLGRADGTFLALVSSSQQANMLAFGVLSFATLISPGAQTAQHSPHMLPRVDRKKIKWTSSRRGKTPPKKPNQTQKSPKTPPQQQQKKAPLTPLLPQRKTQTKSKKEINHQKTEGSLLKSREKDGQQKKNNKKKKLLAKASNN